jgi:DnaJ-class molecular chaperone
MRARAFRDDGGDQIAVRPADDSRHEASCFADDVIIDFPSMATALDRMRRAFLADERQPRISTTIRLSGREAMTGATVPLDVPIRCTCPQCGGRGESWTEQCLRCHGSGEELRHHPFQVTLPAGVEHGARFHFTVTLRQHSSTRVELHVHVI